MNDETIEYAFQDQRFILDRKKAELALSEKRAIGGKKKSSFFSLMPLRYPWAYELFRDMLANNWVPEEVPMSEDVYQWKEKQILSEGERHIVRLAIGYFCSAEGIVGDTQETIIRENISAPEIRLALGRQVQEENIHIDSLLYMISSLGINPHEMTALFLSLPSVIKKNELICKSLPQLYGELDFGNVETKRLFTKLIFSLTQVMEGTQFFGLFLPLLHLMRQGKMMGIGQMVRFTLRDETNHIELGRRLILTLIEENPEIADASFIDELIECMRLGLACELDFIDDLIPQGIPGLTSQELKNFIRFNANRRLMALGWSPISDILENPLPWSAEVIY
ncbi:MAG TPA: ribonucleotide-diphosphate reductase subunit beta, partial [Chlamydiales bacterium]|nr:ribonucleotide-diphosphate reductase subunit beta [Chlamydiales bacterium]